MRPVLAVTAPLLTLLACTPYQPSPRTEEQPEAPPQAAPVAPVPVPRQLDRRADPPASVAGTVRDPSGRPLAGAQVCAWNLDRNAGSPLPRCVAADASGAYEIAGLPPTRHEVHADAPELQPAGSEPLALRPGERRTGVDLALAPGGARLHGRVVDDRGQPVTGATVTNLDHGGIRSGPRRGAAAAARTDADGNFSLSLTPGVHALVVHAAGFVSAVAEANAPSRQEIALESGSTVSGRVVDLVGAPVAGVRVAALDAGSLQRLGLAYTDADGRYTLTGLRSGLVRQRAEAPGRLGDGARTLYLGSADAAEAAAITLRPAASVSGRLVVAGAAHTCSQGHARLISMENGAALDELAGPDGEVYFPAVAPGTYSVLAECPGAVAPPGFPEVVVAEAPVRDLAWEFAAGRTIRGTIADPQGRPLAGVAVRAHAVHPDCGPGCFAATATYGMGRQCHEDSACAMDEICDRGTCVFAGVAGGTEPRAQASDAAGRFTLIGVPPGQYDVVALAAWQTDPRPVRVNVVEGDVAGAQLVAPPPGQLGGIVVDARGRPDGAAHVELLLDRGTYLTRVTSTRVDADGRFALFDVKPGVYRLRPRRDDGPLLEDPIKPQAGDVRVRVGDATPEVRLALPALPGALAGRLVGPDGAPLAGAVVSVRREPENFDPGSMRDMIRYAAERTLHTDAAGGFAFDRLAPGNYTVWARRPGGVVEVFREHVATGARLELTLPATRAVAGTVTGATLDRFTCNVFGHDLDVARSDTFAHTDGRWAFEGLPPGTYEVHCEAGAVRGDAIVDLADRSRLDLELPFAAPGVLRGRILDADSRVPLGGLQVTALRDGPAMRFAPWPLESFSDDAGRFELGGLPPGRLTLKFPAYEPGELAVTIESGKTVEVWPALRLAADPARP